jgi:hypothetical protein
MATCLRLGVSRNSQRHGFSTTSLGSSGSSIGIASLGFRYKSTSTSGEPRKSWSDTLLLPKTSFPMKHKDIVKEENRWRDRTSTEFYKWQVSRCFSTRSASVFADRTRRARGSGRTTADRSLCCTMAHPTPTDTFIWDTL